MRKMRVLVVEDDHTYCAAYRDRAEWYNDKIEIVNFSRTADEAMENILKYKPHALILSLELAGSHRASLNFLRCLRDAGLNEKLVIAGVSDVYISNQKHLRPARELGVDFDFWRRQNDDVPKNVFNYLDMVRETGHFSDWE